MGEGFQVLDYQQGAATYAAQSLYDLIAGRYSVLGLMNESKRSTEYGKSYTMNDFTPAALRNAGIR
ncbi:hypothetical protein D3C76_1863610 [compost metagenome]